MTNSAMSEATSVASVINVFRIAERRKLLPHVFILFAFFVRVEQPK